MSRSRNLFVALLCLALPAEAAAAECKLTPLAALPLLKTVQNVPVVPAHIDDQWTWLIIDTGAIRSLIFSHTADALNLPRSDLRNSLDSETSLGSGAAVGRVSRRGRGSLPGVSVSAPPPVDTARIVALNARQTDPYSVFGAGGQAITQETSGQHVQLGKLDFPDISFLVIPDSPAGDGGLGGMFGMASLRAYDIELNLSQHWINLFSPDHCDGKVVYWSDSYLAAPIRITETGQIQVQARLDGQSFWAMIDTGASYSSIRQGDASWLFGLGPQSPGAEIVGTTIAADGASLTSYRVPFKSLEVAGVTFSNPQIHVLPNIKDGNLPDRAGLGQKGEAIMTLGVNELSRLRIYLALKEKMLYATPAEPDQPT